MNKSTVWLIAALIITSANIAAAGYFYAHINGLYAQDLRLSIELRELQVQKLHCEFETDRCKR